MLKNSAQERELKHKREIDAPPDIIFGRSFFVRLLRR